jgi:protein transport protein SEC61 subunit beta
MALTVCEKLVCQDFSNRKSWPLFALSSVAKTSPTLIYGLDPTFSTSSAYVNLKMVSFCLNQVHEMSARIVKVASSAGRIEILERTRSLSPLLFLPVVPADLVDRSNGRPHYSLCDLSKLSLTFIPWQSSPRPTSPVNTPSGSSTARPSSPKPPGGPATAIRRKAAADLKEKKENTRPNSTRAAGMGGSSSTMLKLYTDESPGLKVDPVVVLVLSVGFIVSVVALHSTFACELYVFMISG